MNCYFKAYQGSEPYIFISYCHRDKAEVYPLIDRLNIEGYRVWFDEGIQAGDKWLEVVAQNLADAALVVSAVSVGASESHNCINELNFAVSKKKPLVPVVLEDFSMTIALQLLLASTNFIKKFEFSSEDAFYSAFLSSPTLKSCRIATAVPPTPAQLNEWRKRCTEYRRTETPIYDGGNNVLKADPMSAERDRLHKIDLTLTECEHILAAVRSSAERMQGETVSGDRKKYCDALIRKVTDAAERAQALSFDGKWRYFPEDAEEARKRAAAMAEEAQKLTGDLRALSVPLSQFQLESKEIDALSRTFSTLRAEYKELQTSPEKSLVDAEAFLAKLNAVPESGTAWKYFDHDAKKMYDELENMKRSAGMWLTASAVSSGQEKTAEMQSLRQREAACAALEREAAALKKLLDELPTAVQSEEELEALRQRQAAAEKALASVNEKLRALSKPASYRYCTEENAALMRKCGAIAEYVAKHEQRLRESRSATEALARELERKRREEEQRRGELEQRRSEQLRIEKTISELQELDRMITEAVNAAADRPLGAAEAEQLRRRVSGGKEELNRLLRDAGGLRVTRQQAADFRECRDRVIENLKKLEALDRQEPSFDPDATVSLPPAIVIDLDTSELFCIRSAATDLGRKSQQCDIPITENSSISRVHARILFSRGQYYLTDNDSKWGSFVKGKRLEPGEKAALGSATDFELSDEHMMFLSGDGARAVQKLMRLRTLRSIESGETRLLLGEELPLDRRHAWSGNVLNDKYVSHFKHAVIITEGDSCYIQDLDSTNGTRLNEKKLLSGEKYPLRSGDVIRIAKNEFEYKELRLHIGGRMK